MFGQRSYYEPIPLQGRVHQETVLIPLAEVPEIPEQAVVRGVTPRAVRYDHGDERWYVSPSDKQQIRAYLRYRSEDEIAAGANPVFAKYHDGSPLP